LIVAINSNATTVDTLLVGDFGKVRIFTTHNVPNSFVLLVSGSEGWNKELTEIAHNIKAQGALVAGIDLKHYLKQINTTKSRCIYPAGDFESLSMDIQKKYKLNLYLAPVLVGYSTGANFVYGVLAQSPPETFKGAITFGFNPEISTSYQFCEGNGLKSIRIKNKKSYALESCSKLSDPFIVLQGTGEQSKTIDALKVYMSEIRSSELILLPAVKAIFSDTVNWLPKFRFAYSKILRNSNQPGRQILQKEVGEGSKTLLLNINLPITVIPPESNLKLPIVFFISGDGGWRKFEQNISEILARRGMPVIGLDALKYFWNEKQPAETVNDISKVIAYYMEKWNRNSFILVGYSFGAGVVPFIGGDFTGQLKERIVGVYCFSPDVTADFEIHITDMLSINLKEKYNVLNELKKISPLYPITIFGTEEDSKITKQFLARGLKVEILIGDHHYNNNYNAISSILLKEFLNSQ
jgi:type IV secretory pathway VirJ component